MAIPYARGGNAAPGGKTPDCVWLPLDVMSELCFLALALSDVDEKVIW